MFSPTSRQQQVLALIESVQQRTGKRPSYREIAREIGVRSPTSVLKLVHALQRKGLLEGQAKRRARVVDDWD